MKRAEKIAEWIVYLVCLFAVLYFGSHFLAATVYCTP